MKYKATKYPSIPHLPNSKLGKDDKGIHAGMAQYCESKYRDNTKIIVTEKVDGSNVSIYRDPELGIVALSRGGYLAKYSNYEHHINFARYVDKLFSSISIKSNLDTILPIGERVVFEDLTTPHGTIYKNAPKLLLIDWKTSNGRKLWNEYNNFLGIPKVKTIYEGCLPVPVDTIRKTMPKKGFYGAKDGYEGLIYRVERNNKFDFIAKWVMQDYQSLKYLNNSGDK